MKNVIIVGGHEQACRILDHLVETNACHVVLCIGRKDDTGHDGIFPSLLARARKLDIPTLQPARLNAPAILRIAEQAQPDIVLSLQNNMIFGEDWLDLMATKQGIVNIHYAPLPHYGGYWPEMWAIWNDEKRFAVTMHYVAKGLDTGPIIEQRWFDIDPDETRSSLYRKCDRECYAMLQEHLPRIIANRVPSRAQKPEERTFFPRSLPNEGFLDLGWDATTQERFLRAISFPGFPGPKIRVGGQVLTVLCEDIPFFAHVGMVATNMVP